MTSPLPPNILGTGALPPKEEERLLSSGVIYAYYMESIIPGHPPILIACHRDPQEFASEVGRFKSPSGFTLSEVIRDALEPASAFPARRAPSPDAEPAPIPAV